MRALLSGYFPSNYHIPVYWPAETQFILPDGTAVDVAYGAAVVALPGVVQDIAPDGYELVPALGDITVTRRPAAVIPLYEIDLDERTWLVPAENRIYEVDD